MQLYLLELYKKASLGRPVKLARFKGHPYCTFLEYEVENSTGDCKMVVTFTHFTGDFYVDHQLIR